MDFVISDQDDSAKTGAQGPPRPGATPARSWAYSTSWGSFTWQTVSRNLFSIDFMNKIETT